MSGLKKTKMRLIGDWVIAYMPTPIIIGAIIAMMGNCCATWIFCGCGRSIAADRRLRSTRGERMYSTSVLEEAAWSRRRV